jgi:hypothetical protein
MTEFKLGDRVRVRALAGTVPYSGREGEVARVNSTLGGTVYSCLVKLDGSLLGDPCAVAFLQSELDPEPEDTP